jgi:cytidylate kinase
METRQKTVREAQGLSQDAARQYLEERDKSAREYLARFFNAQWDDPYLYHLTINTGACEIEQAAQLIIAGAHHLVSVKAA